MAGRRQIDYDEAVRLHQEESHSCVNRKDNGCLSIDDQSGGETGT